MLPDDILIKIASHLDVRPKKRLNQGNLARAVLFSVCKKWNRVLSNNPDCWENGKWDVIYSMRRYEIFWCSKSMYVSAIRIFGLKLSDFMQGSHELSFFVVENGLNADLFHVLIDELGLTGDHLRQDGNRVLLTAARRNRVDILMVLFERLGMTAIDARVDDNEALDSAATGGYYNVLKVLLNTYGLTVDDVRARNSKALTTTAQLGYTASLYLLIAKFGLPSMDRYMMSNRPDIPRRGVYEYPRLDQSRYSQQLLTVFNEELRKSSSRS